MSGYLPYGEFKWFTQEKINSFDLNSISEKSPIVYILEVDLKYPKELHELHNDYPLAPEKLAILMTCCMLFHLVKNCTLVWNKSWWC